MEDQELRRLLSIETLAAEASEVIARLMVEQNLSKAGLASRLNKSRAWVTQLLNGKANTTLHTLVEVVHALGAGVKLHAQPPSRQIMGKMAGKTANAGQQPTAISRPARRAPSSPAAHKIAVHKP
jgi:transcriptional regulator with XRE-family HTH domain